MNNGLREQLEDERSKYNKLLIRNNVEINKLHNQNIKLAEMMLCLSRRIFEGV